MKTVAMLTLLSLFLFSCGEDADNTDSNDSEVIVETVDSTETVVEEEIVDSTETVIEEEIVDDLYSTVEDYGQITSKDQLISEFGEENLVDGESWYAEGTVRIENTVLTNPENGQVIKYLWEEDGNTTNYLEVNYYIFDENFNILGTQVIACECGLRLGMSLEDFREWNGADFDFFGFGWDYEGGILNDEGSNIEECPIQIKLSFDLEIEIPEDYYGMYSDQVYNTADDITQGAPVLIDRLTYYPVEM